MYLILLCMRAVQNLCDTGCCIRLSPIFWVEKFDLKYFLLVKVAASGFEGTVIDIVKTARSHRHATLYIATCMSWLLDS